MKAEYSAQELSISMGISTRAVRKYADQNAWVLREDPNPNAGKPRKLYLTASMNADFVKRLAAAEEFQQETLPAADPVQTSSLPHAPAAIDPHRKALARADLLKHYTEALEAAPWG